MSDEDDPTIVPLFPGSEDENPIARAGHGPGTFCAHRQVTINDEAHRLYCRECGREVDPLDFLKRLSGEWDRWERGKQEAERQCKVAQAHLAELKRQLNNAKGRARRAGVDVRAAAREAERLLWEERRAEHEARQG